MRGTVVFFKNETGYGFIAPEDGSKDIFVHHQNIQMDGYRTLAKGDRVEFRVEIGPKGKPQAVDVSVMGRAVA